MRSSIHALLGSAALLCPIVSVNIAAAEGPTNVVVSPSVEASSDPNEPRMETEVTRRSLPNVPLLATGSVLLAAGYAPAAIGGALSAREEDEKLYIPVAGPWMTLTRGEQESGGERTLLVLDGAVQGIGALALLTSFFIPEKKTENWYLIGSNQRFNLMPTGLGLGARGRF